LPSVFSQTVAGYTSDGGTKWDGLVPAKFTKAHPGPAPADKTDKTIKVPSNGWSNEGLKLFNDVCRSIIEDRAACPNFDEDYMEWAKTMQQAAAGSKRKRREVVAVYNELGLFRGNG
jgi:hypothetical protein